MFPLHLLLHNRNPSPLIECTIWAWKMKQRVILIRRRLRDTRSLRCAATVPQPDYWQLFGGGTDRKAPLEFSLNLFQALSLRLRTSIVTFDISCALRLNNSSSYSVNTRGAGEVPSFRLSKSIEGVAELVFPPVFKVFAMSSFQASYGSYIPRYSSILRLAITSPAIR